MAMDPFADLLTLQREMDRIMTKFGAQTHHTGEEQGQNLWTPAVDVFKQGQDMVVRAELPGVNPADINVSVTGNMLTIKGERRQERQTDENDYVMRETTYGSFERRVTMPEDIDAGQVRAQYRAGVLEVTIPRAAFLATQPHNVAVQGAQQQQSMTSGQQSMGTQQGMGTSQTAGMRQGEGAQQQGQMGQTDTSQYQQTAGYGREQRSEDYRQGYEQQRQESTQTSGSSQPYTPEQADTGQQGYRETQQVPPVQTQGGWVTPESQTSGQSAPSEQQMGSSYDYGQQEQQPQGGAEPDRQQEEERRRSRLGGWLHGER